MAAKDWVCATCYVQNRGTALYCPVCGEKNPNPSPEAHAAGTAELVSTAATVTGSSEKAKVSLARPVLWLLLLLFTAAVAILHWGQPVLFHNLSMRLMNEWPKIVSWSVQGELFNPQMKSWEDGLQLLQALPETIARANQPFVHSNAFETLYGNAYAADGVVGVLTKIWEIVSRWATDLWTHTDGRTCIVFCLIWLMYLFSCAKADRSRTMRSGVWVFLRTFGIFVVDTAVSVLYGFQYQNGNPMMVIQVLRWLLAMQSVGLILLIIRQRRLNSTDEDTESRVFHVREYRWCLALFLLLLIAMLAV